MDLQRRRFCPAAPAFSALVHPDAWLITIRELDAGPLQRVPSRPPSVRNLPIGSRLRWSGMGKAAIV